MGRHLVLGLLLMGLASWAAIPRADVWHIVPLETEGSTGEYTSIALDSDDNSHIAYYNNTEGGLKHAWHDGGSWHREMVDAGDNVGWWTSIAVDSNGYPHISYHNFTASALKYARFDGSVWHLEFIAPHVQNGHVLPARIPFGPGPVCLPKRVRSCRSSGPRHGLLRSRTVLRLAESADGAAKSIWTLWRVEEVVVQSPGSVWSRGVSVADRCRVGICCTVR
jgi:hypothetical protein